MTSEFMRAEDFKLGAYVRAGSGYNCLEEGEILQVQDDGGGNLCLRCQYNGQKHKGYHYPLNWNTESDEQLNQLYLAKPPIAGPIELDHEMLCRDALLDCRTPPVSE
jgi:hypothetical protein